MSLLKNVGTIGGLTLVSRVFGFARDILLARVLGAGGIDLGAVDRTVQPGGQRRRFGHQSAGMAEGAGGGVEVSLTQRGFPALHVGLGQLAAERFDALVAGVSPGLCDAA